MTIIHQHIKWSSDISTAPKGEMVATKRVVSIKGEPTEQTIEAFVPTFIMALTKCGKIVRTYWLPGKEGTLDGERWSGLNRGEQPLLWAAWPDAVELGATLAAADVAEAAAKVFSREDAA